LTVPDIARRYQVSRQHIQVTVNGLLDRGLLETQANPRHKRSPLLGLSTRGATAFSSIRRREQRRVDALFADIEIADIATTKRTLQRLLERLGEETPS
jgi:DNA-binding MarR family transcriptional regulator